MRKYWLFLQWPLVWTACRSATEPTPQYLSPETVAVAQPANLNAVIDSLAVLPRQQWQMNDVLAEEALSEVVRVSVAQPQKSQTAQKKTASAVKVSPQKTTEPIKKELINEKKGEKKPDLSVKPDVSPAFPGGDRALIAFLRDNKNMPAKALKDGAKGTVYVRFWVAEDGTLNKPTIEKSVYPYLDMEALRLVALMPKWVPAQKNGKKIGSFYSLSISFE